MEKVCGKEQLAHRGSAMLSRHENYLWSNTVLGDALLLTVTRFLDKTGFAAFPVGCVALHVGDVVHRALQARSSCAVGPRCLAELGRAAL